MARETQTRTFTHLLLVVILRRIRIIFYREVRIYSGRSRRREYEGENIQDG